MQAIRMIINGYKTIINRGGNNPENRKGLLKDFILAANYAGIAFGNAGCGAVHALSYAHGGAFHIAHGEAISFVLRKCSRCICERLRVER